MSIQKAKEFAIEMHKGQKYAQGDYFENHVEGVASSVNKSLSEKNIIICGQILFFEIFWEVFLAWDGRGTFQEYPWGVFHSCR